LRSSPHPTANATRVALAQNLDSGRALLAVSAPASAGVHPGARLHEPGSINHQCGKHSSLQKTLVAGHHTASRPRRRSRPNLAVWPDATVELRSTGPATVTQLASLRLPSATCPRRPLGLPLSGDAGNGNSALLAAFS